MSTPKSFILYRDGCSKISQTDMNCPFPGSQNSHHLFVQRLAIDLACFPPLSSHMLWFVNNLLLYSPFLSGSLLDTGSFLSFFSSISYWLSPSNATLFYLQTTHLGFSLMSVLRCLTLNHVAHLYYLALPSWPIPSSQGLLCIHIWYIPYTKPLLNCLMTYFFPLLTNNPLKLKPSPFCPRAFISLSKTSQRSVLASLSYTSRPFSYFCLNIFKQIVAPFYQKATSDWSLHYQYLFSLSSSCSVKIIQSPLILSLFSHSCFSFSQMIANIHWQLPPVKSLTIQPSTDISHSECMLKSKYKI